LFDGTIGGTGAVGHGICLRLLYQLSQPFQLDLSSAYHLKSDQERREEIEQQKGELDEDYQSIYGTPNGLTLLVGCRSESKCRTTQIELEKGLRRLIEAEGKDEQEDLIFSYIDRQSGQVETMTFYEYRSRWLDQLTIEWVPMDLYHAQSVVDAVKLVNQRYGYLTHLLLNAGGGPFVGIDWIGLVKAFLRNFLNALT
jgi:3-keto steroid reductase